MRPTPSLNRPSNLSMASTCVYEKHKLVQKIMTKTELVRRHSGLRRHGCREVKPEVSYC